MEDADLVGSEVSTVAAVLMASMTRIVVNFLTVSIFFFLISLDIILVSRFDGCFPSLDVVTVYKSIG